VGKKLDILLAENAGFCMGVRRALKLTLDAANDPSNPRPIATVGPLIHNRQVLEVLEQKGVNTLEEGAGGDTSFGGTAIIRAHGVSPQEHERLGRQAQRLVDATCPHVRKVQKIAEKYCTQGYHCIIVGDAGHAEVEGVLAYTQGRGIVVSRREDVANLPPDLQRVAVVAQTTQDEQLYAEIAEDLRRRYPGCEVFDTICQSTHRRQAEAKRIAEQVDVMVVVGGRHSANTRRLAEICAQTGTPTVHVETAEELDIDRLLECASIGITAGASTPNWMIRRVVHRIRSEHERRARSARYLLRHALVVPIRTNVFLGGAAAAMTFASCRLMNVNPPRLDRCMALAFFFILSQHLLNQYTKRDAMYLNEPERGEFFKANAGALKMLGLASAVLALVLSFLLGWLPFALIAAGTVGGVLYCLPSERGLWRLARPRGLHGLAGSKELFVGLAWAVTTALIPALAAGALPVGHAVSSPAGLVAGGATKLAGVLVALVFTFLLAADRTLLTDLRDVEGDQLVGRETLAVVLGDAASKRLLAVVLALEALVLVAGELLGWTPPGGSLMLLAVAWSALWLVLFHKGRLPETELGEALVDSKFYLCGLLALAATVSL